MARRGKDWSAEQIAQLRQLWAEGHSGTAIGARMGFTKSAVCGKVHRLGLPSRGSPIGRVGPAAVRPAVVPPRGQGPKPPLRFIPDSARALHMAQARQQTPATGGVATPPGPRVAPSAPSPASGHQSNVVPLRPAAPAGPVRQCTWLDGKRPPYLRCESPTAGGSWCEAHRAIVFRQMEVREA